MSGLKPIALLATAVATVVSFQSAVFAGDAAPRVHSPGYPFPFPIGQGQSDNPARNPFAASETVTVGASFAGVFNTPIADVPEGRRLVIEYVSVRCFSPAGNPIVETLVGVTETLDNGSTTRSFEVPVRYQGDSPFGGPTYVGALATRLYSDPGGLSGGGVTAGVQRENGTGEAACTFAISGHTISVP
jgi:hypothetical protein